MGCPMPQIQESRGRAPDAPLSDAEIGALRAAMLDTYFKGSWASLLECPNAEQAVADHVDGRYNVCRRWLVPWVRAYRTTSRPSLAGTSPG